MQTAGALILQTQRLQTQRLQTRGLRVTRPRLTVLAILDDATARHEHLAVTQVTERARGVLGTLSKQAAYDCLEALAGAGLARRIEPAGHPARYEAQVNDNHHHLVCRDCGATTDADCAVESAPCMLPAATHGFVVDEAEVIFWGRCAACAAGATSGPPHSGEPVAVRPRSAATAERLPPTPSSEREDPR